ncbi:MAG: hypothetical protein ABWY57_17465 [Mycetocola sp.]
MSAHLACMLDCGLITSRPHDRAALFSLMSSAELLLLLSAAEDPLAATGYAVTLARTMASHSTSRKLKAHEPRSWSRRQGQYPRDW